MSRTCMCMVVVVVGCGRVGFDPLGSDALVNDTIGTGPFGTPMLLTEINSPFDDDDPTLSPDLREIVFDSERTGPIGELWAAVRADTSSPWSSPTLIVELSAPADDEDSPFISRDGLELYFSSDRPGGAGSADLWLSTRPDLASAWGAPAVIPALSSTAQDIGFSMTADGLVALLTSSGEIYEATRPTATSAWSARQLRAELNSTSLEDEPMLTVDGLTCLFSSARNGAADLFIAARASRAVPFAPPQPLTEINTPSEEETDPWISADGHLLVFTRGAGSSRDLYYATR